MSTSEKGFRQRIQESPKYGRFLELAKLASITGGAQVSIQAIGLLSGIIVIRLLSTEEYAFYTLANTMLGVMTVLTDSGIGAGVTAEGGKVWKSSEKMGVVLNTGMDLRKKFAVGSLLLATPILIYLLHHHGASWWMSLLIVLSLVPALIGSLSGSIFMIPMKLRQDIKPLQGNLIKESLGRFSLILSLFLLPWTFIAILASGIPRLYMNIRLKKLSKGYVDWNQPIDLEVRTRILAIVKRIMPGAIYYCVSGQISIWLLSIFGTTASVAQIGALGRIAVALTVLNTLFGRLVFPRFARLEQNTKVLLKRFLQIMAALTIVCSFIITGVYLFSNQILWVLGDQYQSLNFALVLSMTSSIIGLLSGAIFRMSTHRGWAVHPGLSIPVSIGAIIIGAMIMDVSQLEGILKFNIFVVVVQLVLNLAYFLFQIKKHSTNEELIS